MTYTLVDYIAFNKVVLDNLSSPNTECSTTFTMNAVTNTYNGIKVINLCWTILVLSIMQKMHITIFFKFTLFQCIVYMSGYNRLILLEKLSHLSLCQPHSLILQSDINLCLSILCLIDYYLLLFFHNIHFV